MFRGLTTRGLRSRGSYIQGFLSEGVLIFSGFSIRASYFHGFLHLRVLTSGAPNENIVQNHLNIALLDVF